MLPRLSVFLLYRFTVSRYHCLTVLRSHGLSFLSLLCGLLFYGCSTFHYLKVESQYPAAITFPEELSRVLIVNNALPQDTVPFESDFRVVPDTVVFKADSAAFDFCRVLGEELAQFQSFDDVRLLEGCFRKDDSPLSAVMLQPEDVKRLTEEHGVDVVISLDRLLFKVNEYMHTISVLDMFGVVDIYVTGVLRVYTPDRQTPLTSILVTDTIKPDLWLTWNDMTLGDVAYLVDINELIRQSAEYVGYEARKDFIPYWNQDVRWFYSSIGTKWQEASAYAKADRWDEALAIWKELDTQAKSWKQKARLASNIALGEELTGHLDRAYTSAEQAYRLMLDHLGESDKTVKKQEVYLKVLAARMSESSRLQFQLKSNH